MSRVLGFDFGVRAIGVALAETDMGSARPLEIVPARNGVPDWRRVDLLVKEWQPGGLVVGMPYAGGFGDQTIVVRARKFSRQLHGRYGLTCEEVDEHLSTDEAKRRARELGRNPRARCDDLAAQVILETWIAR